MGKEKLREFYGYKPGTEGVQVHGSIVFPRDDSYRCVFYDLNTPRTDEEIAIPCWSMTVEVLTGTASVKLNSASNDSKPIAAGDEIEFDIDKVYLTNTQQSGKTLVLSFWWREEEVYP
jgi:hypothetical protein